MTPTNAPLASPADGLSHGSPHRARPLRSLLGPALALLLIPCLICLGGCGLWRNMQEIAGYTSRDAFVNQLQKSRDLFFQLKVGLDKAQGAMKRLAEVAPEDRRPLYKELRKQHKQNRKLLKKLDKRLEKTEQAVQLLLDDRQEQIAQSYNVELRQSRQRQLEGFRQAYGRISTRMTRVWESCQELLLEQYQEPIDQLSGELKDQGVIAALRQAVPGIEARTTELRDDLTTMITQTTQFIVEFIPED